MLDSEEFDRWSDSYDNDVNESDDRNVYPFAGYSEVICKIFDFVSKQGAVEILDLGFGTGYLTSKFYDKGISVWGQDFSQKMVERAKKKMPEANLFVGNFEKELHPQILNHKFDFIIATYSLHHLRDDSKIELIKKLLGLLSDNGKIVIGDIAFETYADQDKCRLLAGDEWDDEEFYFVCQKFNSYLSLRFDKVSYCSGILTIPKQ